MDKKAPASIKRSLRKRKGPVSYPCVESIRYPMVKIQLGPDFFFRPKKLARKRLAAKAAKPPKNDVLDSSKTGLVQLCKDFVAMLKVGNFVLRPDGFYRVCCCWRSRFVNSPHRNGPMRKSIMKRLD
jgi:hypothetical protein